jgi:spore coat polysaccharide biosynthesis predicted glycosyltransferase SpsG/ribosomal protein S18 acetylase RimI-like enzyme
MLKVMFRCDGGAQPEVGTGHVRRCILIADWLSSNQICKIAFLMKKEALENRRVEEKNYELHLIEQGKDTFEQTLRAVQAFSPDILVLDILNSGEKYIQTLRDTGTLVISLDDDGPNQKSADVAINAILENGSTLFEGPDYIVLPELQINKNQLSQNCKRLFISFGGYDHLNLAMKVLRALQHLSKDLTITVAVGDSYQNIDDLKNFAETATPKINVYVNPSNFGELFNEADLAVVSGGLTLFEAMARGVPSIVISQYTHQAKTAQRYHDRKAIIFLGMGNQVSECAIEEKVSAIAKDYRLRNSLRKQALSFVDGNGLQRVANIIRIVNILYWDTEFFGVKIASLNTLRLNSRIVKYAIDFCQKEQVKCLYYLSDCHDALSVKLAELNGFHFVDIRLTFDNNLSDTYTYSKKNLTYEIRESTINDLKACQDIARKSYLDSRYYFDHHFSRELCEKFYTNWVAKSILGETGNAFVAELNDEIVGYLTYNLNENSSLGRIMLIGIKDSLRGTGVGTALIYHLLDLFQRQGVTRVEVVTQGRNVSAQRLYQKCGFKTQKTQLWYHKWFE